MTIRLRRTFAAATLLAGIAGPLAAQILESAPQKPAPAKAAVAPVAPPAIAAQDESNLPTGVWVGSVVHTSAQSVRVYSDREKRDLTFIVFSLPHNLWNENGITTYAMDKLAPGAKVRVVYTHILGIRKAKAIYVYDAGGTAHRIHG